MKLDHTQALSALAQALVRVEAFDEVGPAVARYAGEALGASTAFLAIMPEPGVSVAAVTRIDTTLLEPEHLAVPLAAALPLMRTLTTGTTLVVRDNEHLTQIQCDEPELRRVDPDDHACASIALRVGDDVVGAINLGFDDPADWSDELLERAQLLADLAAPAVERIRRLEATRLMASAARALDIVGDGVVVLDAANVIRAWTGSTRRLTGIDARDAIGRPIDSVIHEWPRLVRYVEVAEEDAPLENRVRNPIPVSLPTGERWLSLAGTRVQDATIYVVRDVTDEQLRGARVFDEVATAAHQLRTPLTAISGAADTLLRDDIEIPMETRHMFEEMIATGARRLTSVIDSILKAESMRGPVSATPRRERDVAELVTSAAGRVHEAMRPTGTLVLAVEDAGPPVLVDDESLELVVTNLVENACKYSPADAPIEVGVTVVGDQLTLTISDHGIGMDDETRRRAFDKFYRADPAMASGVEGTGLGLYIVATAVERTGGSIDVSSVLEQGTTFTVTLPVGDPNAARVRRARQDTRTMRTDASIAHLAAGVQALDSRAIHDELSYLAARYGREIVADELVVPMLRELGSAEPMDGPSIAREHVFSQAIMGRLASRSRTWSSPGRPVALVTCGPREMHELGAMLFAGKLVDQGWSVEWLGSLGDLDAIEHAIDTLAPQVTVVVQHVAKLGDDEVSRLDELAARSPVLVAGGMAHTLEGRARVAVACTGDISETLQHPALQAAQVPHVTA